MSLIPEEQKGKSVDLEHSVTCSDAEHAQALFDKACERLLRPSTWHELTGDPGAVFSVIDPVSNTKKSTTAVNDFIRVDIPGPGLKAGDGHDWVRIAEISPVADENADQSFGMTVKVSPNPNNPEEGIAHFFAKDASSTFVIKRKGTIVIASYHGRNEAPNTDNPRITDKIRNTIVALGALAGISELQWKALLKGLLSD